MATFTQIQTKHGIKTRAQVRWKGGKSKAKTFDTKLDAKKWAQRIEVELDEPEHVVVVDLLTIAELIRKYRQWRIDLGRPIEPDTNTRYMLDHLEDDIGATPLLDMTPEKFVQWAKMRREQGAGGYTINMEFSQLGTVIRQMSPILKKALPDVVGAARPTLFYGQLITGGKRRSRRPTEDEGERLLEYVDSIDKRRGDAIRVSRVTGMRRGELVRIQWTDLVEPVRSVWVRGRKHPRKIERHDDLVPLLGDAWDIVMRQPRTSERIFPVTKEMMTDIVTDGCKVLGIPDLHLHDMRRDANSALRELGFDEYERMKVVGHRDNESQHIYSCGISGAIRGQ